MEPPCGFCSHVSSIRHLAGDCLCAFAFPSNVSFLNFEMHVASDKAIKLYFSNRSCFYQLLLDLLGYSASIFAALTRYPSAVDKGLMSIIENFILEELDLIKGCISAVKVLISDLYCSTCCVSCEYSYSSFSPLLVSTSFSYPKNVMKLFHHGAIIVICDTLNIKSLALHKTTVITMSKLASEPLFVQVPATMPLQQFSIRVKLLLHWPF